MYQKFYESGAEVGNKRDLSISHYSRRGLMGTPSDAYSTLD